MRYGIINLSLIPVRADKTDRSEMVNQLLFGDTVEILKQEDKWLKIRSSHDGYEGWMDEKQLMEIPANTYELTGKHSQYHLLDINAEAKSADNKLQIVAGSSLPYYKNKSFVLGQEKFSTKGKVADDKTFKANEENIIAVANSYLGTPYLWGGRSPFGIDCSGFTQVVFKVFGVKLNRDAYQQAEQGRPVDFVENTQPGDLAFFHNENKRVIHVGIVIKDKKIIHASGRVRVDTLDHHGIYNHEKKNYSHHLTCIRRVL